MFSRIFMLCSQGVWPQYPIISLDWMTEPAKLSSSPINACSKALLPDPTEILVSLVWATISTMECTIDNTST